MSFTTFILQNITGKVMTIVHEPECFEFELPVNEEIEIETDCHPDSIVLLFSEDEGQPLLSILSSKSLYTVKYKGQDAFAKFLDS
jgi:hypothetical protein